MIIREAEISDVMALNQLVERAYRGDSARRGWTHEADLLDGQRTDVEVLSDIIADPNQKVLLAIQDGALCGCVQISRKNDTTAYLGMLSVDPDLQSAGLGRSLIAAAETFAIRRFDSTAMEMTVIRQRLELIAYYERRGYTLTDETRPFPYDDERFGLPKTKELAFVVLVKSLQD
jgi:ribosomal protein S18 acetylase RimI-like enzyme